MPDRQTKTYKIVAISLYLDEAKRADRLTEVLRRAGWPRANRSLVMREGLSRLEEDLADKSEHEVLQYFVERQAARARRHATTPTALPDVTPEPAELPDASPEPSAAAGSDPLKD